MASSPLDGLKNHGAWPLLYDYAAFKGIDIAAGETVGNTSVNEEDALILEKKSSLTS